MPMALRATLLHHFLTESFLATWLNQSDDLASASLNLEHACLALLRSDLIDEVFEPSAEELIAHNLLAEHRRV